KDHFRDAPRCADKRRHHSEAKSYAASSLLGHRITIKACYSVRRVTRQIEQDGANGPTILRAIHHAGEHQNCSNRFDAECQRQQNRNCRERAHARQHANHVADQHPNEAPHDVVWLNGDTKTVQRSVSAVAITSLSMSAVASGLEAGTKNNPTPNTVTTAAKVAAALSVALRSPSADTNTQVKVAGISPK